MARLYEYAASNDKSGYFLRGGTSGSNYTLGVTALGRRLFDHLGYDPGVVNKERGPRIPSQLHWSMYEAGLIRPGDSDPSGHGIDGEIDVDETELTEEQIDELEQFIRSADTSRSEIQELAEIFGFDPGPETSDATDGPKNIIWEVHGKAAEIVANEIQSTLKGRLSPGENSGRFEVESMRCSDASKLFDETTTFQVRTATEDGSTKEQHQLVFVEGDGLTQITSTTNVALEWDDRVRIQKQQMDILDTIRRVSNGPLDMYLGDPADLPDIEIIDRAANPHDRIPRQ